MNIQSRKEFLTQFGLGMISGLGVAPLLADPKKNKDRFNIGIQEYTFHRWLNSGKLDHLDYPALVKKELGISYVEYWNRPFGGKHTDKKYVGELVKRTKGEGIKNVLILVDEKHELDHAVKTERDKSVELHKAWIDCAAQLGCDAIRVNCRSGGDPDENLKQAVDGMGRLCDYAKGTPVKVIIEPHGRNSQNPDWLVSVIKELNHSHAGLLPDFNNFGKYDRYRAVRMTLPFASAVCAKALKFDAKGNEKSTDYERMLKIVHDSNYSGVISIEFEGHDLDPIAGSQKTKELILRGLEKSPCFLIVSLVNGTPSDSKPVLIVGAGMAGLACAVTLHRSGVPFLLFDRDEKVGGRVQTDEIDGYRLDRGFQVLLTAYPEAKRFLDYKKLELKSCYPGSRVWYNGKFHQVSDPFRHPFDGVCSIFNPIGSFFDKLKVGMLRMGLKSTSRYPNDVPTIEALQDLGFSEQMINRFWKPFMRGVFLENDLSTTVRKFEETFRLFAEGETVSPRLGIGEIPRQMAAQLPVEQLKLGHSVTDVHAQEIKTKDGKSWQGRAVVLATDFASADRLLNMDSKPREWNAVDCFYYSFPEAELPTSRPILHLNGSGEGPINNLSFVSSFTDCAPVGNGLLSASVIGEKDKKVEDLEIEVKQQLIEWFGETAQKWKDIQVYRIKQAVPVCECPAKEEMRINGIYRCGDYLGLPSIDSAMRSGRKVAESIIESFS